jgi:hypothetical protein
MSNDERARTRGRVRVKSSRRVPGGFVFLGVHHGIEFALVRHANLHEPTVSESGFVHRARGVRQALVDFDDFARNRRVDIGRRLDGFNDAERGRLFNLATNFRKFDVHNVTQFRLFSFVRATSVSQSVRLVVKTARAHPPPPPLGGTHAPSTRIQISRYRRPPRVLSTFSPSRLNNNSNRTRDRPTPLSRRFGRLGSPLCGVFCFTHLRVIGDPDRRDVAFHLGPLVRGHVFQSLNHCVAFQSSSSSSSSSVHRVRSSSL